MEKTIMSEKYIVSDSSSRTEWDKFVTSHEEANFLQSWDFYEFHKSRGKDIVRREVRNSDNKIVAVYAGEVEHAKRGTYMAIAGGPIIDWTDNSAVKAVFDDMRSQGEKRGCVYVRVRPQCEWTLENERIFSKAGFKVAPYYLSVEFAGVLDLTKSEDELLANMRQRLRRALRKAAKNDVIIEKSTDPKDIHTFYEIEKQTANRHKFVAFSEDFLTKQFTALAKNNEAVLYTAKINGEILAQNFMIFYGNEASYHYGVSSELGTKLSSAPMLHMEAMRDARKRGIKRYNLWGIVDEKDTKHRFYGVSEFKRGFGPTELKYLPARDLVLKPFSYYTKNYPIEFIRRHIRHV